MRTRGFLVLTAIVTFVIASFACVFGGTHYVSGSGSNTPPYDTWEKASHTIQAAIGASGSGDTILVAPGTYSPASGEQFPIQMNGIPIMGVGEASETIIDRQGMGDVFHTEGPVSLTRVTVTGGSGDGVYFYSPSHADVASIVDCRIVNNQGVAVHGAMDYGVNISNSIVSGNGQVIVSEGAISIESSVVSDSDLGVAATNMDIKDCEFTGNGGGLFMFVTYGGGILSLIRTNITHNGAGVSIGPDLRILYMEGCIVAHNTGGGVGCSEAYSCTIIGSTICNNTGYGIAAFLSPVSVSASIISRNGGPSLTCYGPHCPPTLACCDIFGNQGGDWVECIVDQYGVNGNISLDPLFCSPDRDDFRLSSNSPCLNPNGCGQVGALGVGCSPPAVEATTWGRIKGMYR